MSYRALKLFRQPYYRWLAAPVIDAELTAAYRANALFDAHREDPEFGYRFLAGEASTVGKSMAVGPRGGSTVTTFGDRCLERRAVATADDRGHPFMTIWSGTTSPLRRQIVCG